MISVTAIIVSGGNDAEKSVELLHGDGTPWCSLPDLPEVRSHHTQTGLLICGGVDTEKIWTSCVRFSGGKWEPSHELKKERYYHSSWASPRGTVLIGGMDNDKTTELLDDTTGGSIIHFPLKYKIE